MHILPNGQNIQFLPPIQNNPPPQTITYGADPKVNKTPTSKMVLTKDIAPHLNRKQRRQQEAMLKAQAKQQAAEAAKKEIARQKKEKADGQ